MIMSMKAVLNFKKIQGTKLFITKVYNVFLHINKFLLLVSHYSSLFIFCLFLYTIFILFSFFIRFISASVVRSISVLDVSGVIRLF